MDNLDGVLSSNAFNHVIPFSRCRGSVFALYRYLPQELDNVFESCHDFIDLCAERGMLDVYSINYTILDKRRRILKKTKVPFGYIPFDKIPSDIVNKDATECWRLLFHLFLQYGYSNEGLNIANSYRSMLKATPKT